MPRSGARLPCAVAREGRPQLTCGPRNGEFRHLGGTRHLEIALPQAYLVALRRAARRIPFARRVCREPGWRPAGMASTGPTRIYASAQISFLPAELDHQHGDTAGWVPGGTLIPVTGPLAS